MQRPRAAPHRAAPWVPGIALALLAGLAAADEAPGGAADAVPVPLDAALDADAIYERVLQNRFQAAVQEVSLASGDRTGRVQPIRVMMLWRRYGEGTAEAESGVQSRTLVRYLDPSDVQDTGYLVIAKRDQPNDQFIYLKSMRRIRRINLQTESLVGTDLSIEDIIPREMEDADYRRLPDAALDGAPCYVVEAIPRRETASQYSRLELAVEGGHFVPLRTRYWDQAGVEIKELRAPLDSVREVRGVWLPIRAEMRHLLRETFTRLAIERLVPDPDLPKKWFTQRQLLASKLRLPKELRRAAIALE